MIQNQFLWTLTYILGHPNQQGSFQQCTKCTKKTKTKSAVLPTSLMSFFLLHSNGKIVAPLNWQWWKSVSFKELIMTSDVLFCSVMSPLAFLRGPTAELIKQTRNRSSSSSIGGALKNYIKIILLVVHSTDHYSIMLFTAQNNQRLQELSVYFNLQYSGQYFIRNCISEACKSMNGVDTKSWGEDQQQLVNCVPHDH